jgi:hypothetical protein
MKYLFLLCLFSTLSLADVSAEKLAEIRQQALEQAVIFHKGKNPSTSQLLQTAREFEDYLLNQKPVSKPVAVKKIPQVEEKPTYNASTYKGSDKVKKASHFKGLSLGANVSSKSTTVKVEGGVSDVTSYNMDGTKNKTSRNYEFDGLGQSGIQGDLTIDYGYQFSDKGLLLFGASYSINDFDLLDFTLANSGSSSYSAEAKKNYSLSVAPAYELSENVLSYFKLSYHHFDLETSNNGGLTNDNIGVHGYGVALGLKSQVTENLFATVEMKRVMHSKDSLITHELGTGSTVGTVGLSYNFNGSPVVFDSRASDFSGLTVGVTGELKSTMSKYDVGSNFYSNYYTSGVPRTRYDATLDSAGNQHTASSMTLAYTFPVAHRTFLMAGGTYAIADKKVFEISNSEGNVITFEEQDHFSLFVAPAYQLSNNSLGYVKFAYHDTSINLSGRFSDENAQGAMVSTSYTEDMNGYGIGVGLRSEIYRDIFADMEIQHVMYGSQSTNVSSSINLDTTSTIGNVGISYKF